jgi:hypothetical protein
MNCCRREVYAVERGDYVGRMFAIVDPRDDVIGCLSLPQMENIEVPLESFENGRNNDIIKFVEKLPRKVYSVIEAQYKKNENTDNRREQLNTPNVLYSEDAVEEDKNTHGLSSK